MSLELAIHSGMAAFRLGAPSWNTEMLRIVFVAILTFALPASAQTVVDGDTIKQGGTTYRLWGIDAAESKQLCADAWPAGTEATKALARLMADKTVTCDARVKDRYGRTVALCRAGDLDLGSEMVRIGMAWAFTRYSSDYVGEERDALRRGLGVHAHQCEKPWDYRARIRGDK